ncbi:adenylate/guanylate cyclase domain-containing protein [Marinibaculum pumilum]|uniref:Adenylate/guanylate cyclase domain-containing protein n=1 Tax=Marinibaculum pumilum TaxID=1766165 RepID=A0ABV7L5U2_9PROT
MSAVARSGGWSLPRPGRRAAQLRLASGLVLFAFVATHYLNHAAGLVSLAWMEAGASAFTAVWRSLPGTVLLYGGLVVHAALALWSTFARRTWRGMGRGEAVQILLGLVIVPLAVAHVSATRGIDEFWDFNDRYAYVLHSLYVTESWDGPLQIVLLLVVWLHSCLGIHYWLRLKPWYPRAQLTLYTLAILLPLAALLGFVHAGQEVGRLLGDPAWRDAYRDSLNYAGPQVNAWVYAMNDRVRIGTAVLLAALLAGRYAWILLDRRRMRVTIRYPDSRTAQILPGSATVLEASREAGIPHASVCGGRGRCSTCRVKILEGVAGLADPSADEVRVLRRVNAPPGVRLACQIRPRADLQVVPLLPAGAQPAEARRRDRFATGQEIEICVLFADLRAFTRFSEKKLPYDVVFVANQYFRLMGAAVERAGGRVDKFIGDGVMALFGLAEAEAGGDAGCAAALRAAGYMAQALQELNDSMGHDLDEPFRLGIGIHTGHAIVGEMGYGSAVSITAIGDTVNTASRLEAATKEFGAQLVVSREVVDRAGNPPDAFTAAEIQVRGRDQPLGIYWLADATVLAEETVVG